MAEELRKDDEGRWRVALDSDVDPGPVITSAAKQLQQLKEDEPFVVDIRWWRRNLRHTAQYVKGDWKLEPSLDVLVRTLPRRPNCQTQLSIGNEALEDISAVSWRLISELNNLTHFTIGHSDSTYNFCWVSIASEGVVGVCELLKVCCSIAHLLVDSEMIVEDILSE